jgi:hypothetical protein
MNDAQPTPEPIETSNWHDVNVWTNQQKKAGVLKHCTNLQVVSITMQYDYKKTQKFFLPDCECHSFNWGIFVRDHEDEAQTLIRRLHQNIISCPKNCTNYKPQWIAKTKRPFRWLWAQRKLIPALGNWFTKLSPLVQALIVIGIILAIAPKWKDAIIQIIKAIQGK